MDPGRRGGGNVAICGAIQLFISISPRIGGGAAGVFLRVLFPGSACMAFDLFESFRRKRAEGQRQPGSQEHILGHVEASFKAKLQDYVTFKQFFLPAGVSNFTCLCGPAYLEEVVGGAGRKALLLFIKVAKQQVLESEALRTSDKEKKAEGQKSFKE